MESWKLFILSGYGVMRIEKAGGEWTRWRVIDTSLAYSPPANLLLATPQPLATTYNLNAFFTTSTALSSSQGNSFTFTVVFFPALLKVLVTTLLSRPICP